MRPSHQATCVPVTAMSHTNVACKLMVTLSVAVNIEPRTLVCLEHLIETLVQITSVLTQFLFPGVVVVSTVLRG